MLYFPMILRANKFGQTLYTLNDKIAIWLLSDIGLGGATFSHTIIDKFFSYFLTEFPRPGSVRSFEFGVSKRSTPKSLLRTFSIISPRRE